MNSDWSRDDWVDHFGTSLPSPQNSTEHWNNLMLFGLGFSGGVVVEIQGRSRGCFWEARGSHRSVKRSGGAVRRSLRRREWREDRGWRSRTLPPPQPVASWTRDGSGTSCAPQIFSSCCPRTPPRVPLEHQTVFCGPTYGPCYATAAAFGGAWLCGGFCCIFQVPLTFSPQTEEEEVGWGLEKRVLLLLFYNA